MNNTYAVVNDGLVDNIIIIDTELVGEGSLDFGGDLVEIVDDGGIGWGYDGTKFTKPEDKPLTKDELVKKAEDYREGLISHVNSVTDDWRTELALGIISDKDKVKLTQWVLYAKSVKVLDVSNPDELTWPEMPSSC